MISKQFATIAVATLVLVSGVATVGAAAPTDASASEDPDQPTGPSETPGDGPAGPADTPANQTDDRVPDVPALDNESSERGGANNVSVGPPGGLPDQVPDHVSEIHDTIEAYLVGDIGNLGEAIQSIVADVSEGDTDEKDQSETADEADEQEADEEDEQEQDDEETEEDDDNEADDSDDDDAGPPEDTPGNAPR